MVRNNRVAAVFVLFSIVFAATPLSQCYAYSKSHYLGYVHAITDEILPERTIGTKLQGRSLAIMISGSPLDLDTQQLLLVRLKKTNFFDNIKLSFQETLDAKDHSVAAEVKPNHPTVYETLPSGTIYASPIADPKWPRFSVGYQRHFENAFGKKIFSLSFGENLALLRARNDGFVYELGIQAALIGLMDISPKITRLVNSDYFVGIGLSIVHAQNWQNLIQISHLSSHIGDELLINTPALAKKRINLSYETLKWFTAYKFKSIRPYLAVGYMVNRDPSYIKPFSFEVGCDYLSENKFLFETTRYVFGVHGYFWQQNRYKPTVNLRTGLQFENAVWRGRFLQFLVEYANGHSRHGQFYSKKEHYIGVVIAVAN